MEAIDAIASITTLLGLAKEISKAIGLFIHGVRDAPTEIVECSNHIALMVLELSCIDHLQHQDNLASLFSADELQILVHSLSIAKNSIVGIQNDVLQCSRAIAGKPRGGSRLSWALFDRAKFESAMEQLQRTENRLLFVLQLINMRRSMRAQQASAERGERLLQTLQVNEDNQRSVSDKQESLEMQNLKSNTAVRHQYTLELAHYWRDLLGCDWLLTASKNDFQHFYEFFVRFPILAFTGRMSVTVSLSFRRLAGLRPNVSVLGGGLNFVNIVSSDSEIVSACHRGDTLAVRNLFLEKKAAPNDMSAEARTLIYHAVRSGSEELVQFLIDAGAPVQSKQVLATAWWRHPNIARMLLRTKRADVEALGPQGFTAGAYLYGSSRPKSPQVEFLGILASHSFSNFNARDENGWTILHRAAAWGTAADVRALLLLHASSSRTSRLGWDPVFCAVGYGNFETLQVLWEKMAYDRDSRPEESKDLRGWNLLHIAAGYGNYDAVTFLLEQGVDINAVSTATFRSVPPTLRGKCFKPEEVARSCGPESYAKWTERVFSAGCEVAVSPEDIDWTQEESSELGVCECCDNWNLEELKT